MCVKLHRMKYCDIQEIHNIWSVICTDLATCERTSFPLIYSNLKRSLNVFHKSGIPSIITMSIYSRFFFSLSLPLLHSINQTKRKNIKREINCESFLNALNPQNSQYQPFPLFSKRGKKFFCFNLNIQYQLRNNFPHYA